MPLSYNVGTGVGEVTDPAVGLPMQGMAGRDQITTGVESPLYARAFVIADPESETAAGRVAIIVADIWSGTRRVKDAVLQRLAAAHRGLYADENVLLAGTHTHSAPGGYSGTLLYDFDFSRRRVRRGDGDVHRRRLRPCRRDGACQPRSRADLCQPWRGHRLWSQPLEPAYLCNPQAERDQWGADTDREMLLLKFVKLDDGGQERPVGALNWYPIHPTDRGQKNTLVTGDNKGYASSLFEQQMGHRRQPRRRRSWPRSRTPTAAMSLGTSSSATSRMGSTIAPRWRSTAASSSRSPTPVPDRERGSDRPGRASAHPRRFLQRHDSDPAELAPGRRRSGSSFAAGSSEDSVPQPRPGDRRRHHTAENITRATI